MKTKIKMKYEIIIQPQDDQYCGKCTYKEINDKRHFLTGFNDWYCLLFNRILGSWDFRDKEERPTRCYECKKLTTNFMNMPELDEIK